MKVHCWHQDIRIAVADRAKNGTDQFCCYCDKKRIRVKKEMRDTSHGSIGGPYTKVVVEEPFEKEPCSARE